MKEKCDEKNKCGQSDENREEVKVEKISIEKEEQE